MKSKRCNMKEIEERIWDLENAIRLLEQFLNNKNRIFSSDQLVKTMVANYKKELYNLKRKYESKELTYGQN